jgi:NADPH:quinone reductase-like Zn-dependent oxidoreductase
MKAIVYQGSKIAKVVDRPVPKLRDEYILVKVVAIALNPTDWKHIEWDLGAPGCTCGIDYAGIVEQVGSKVTKNFKKGDRIAGWCPGNNRSNPEDGAFAEYIVAKGDIQIKVPDNFSFEEAASLGCGVGTAGQGLYEPSYGLGLSPPSQPISKPEQILVYGGSTASGTLGIQFLKA